MQELQMLLQKKQVFIQKAVEEIQKNNTEKAIKYLNIENGLTVEMTKILERK